MADTLKTTPLDALHARLGGRMVPFAGYSMPVQYQAGVMKEHLHCRAAAGLFDVSHMGQVVLRPRSGDVADAARALERLVPVDVLGLAEGRQRYALFTNDAGGILDDLMVANRGDHLFLVVNASRKDEDARLMRDALSDACEVERLDDRALLALQGPGAEAALAALAPEVTSMRFMDVREVMMQGIPCIVSRSGYTGEDGFEISVPAVRAEPFAEALLGQEGVAPIGLGARDSLTAGSRALPLWQRHRRDDDARRGGAELGDAEGAAPRRRARGRVPGRRGHPRPAGRWRAAPPRRVCAPRAGHRSGPVLTLHLDSEDEAVGRVTSGVYGPSVDGPVAMGYVPTANAHPGTRLFAEVRGKRLPVTVAEMPFVASGYKR